MILSDSELRQFENIVLPITEEARQAASIDLTLGNQFFIPGGADYYIRSERERIQYSPYIIDALNPEEESHGHYETVPIDTGIVLMPHNFILGHTVESISIPRTMGAFFANRSSIGRIGLFTENAGFVDPNWLGNLTVELYNARNLPMRIYPGMPIGQLVVVMVHGEVALPYGEYELGSKYRYAETVQASRLGS